MKRKCIWLCIFLGVWLLFSQPSCYAEQTYRITEQELTQLEINLIQLKSNNESKKKELTKLLIQLNTLKALQQQTQTSLDNANKSLQAYAKEVKAKQRRIEFQRNMAYTLAIGTIIVYAKEKL